MSDSDYEKIFNKPPTLIDKSLLAISFPNTAKKPQKSAYSISNQTFYDEEKPNDENEEYVEFELYATKLTNLANRKIMSADEVEDSDNQIVYCSTPDMSEDGVSNYDRELKITIQSLPYGVVINYNVYLTYEQWNTLIFIDLVLVKCVVCEMFSDVDSSGLHIKSEPHITELNKYKPLARYDLSITRKIREQYHCAVCNEAFSLDTDVEHYASKSHEGNLLSAINKVSELDIDCVINDDNENTNNGTTKNKDHYDFNINLSNDKNNDNLNRNSNNDGNTVNDSDHFNAAAIYRNSSESDGFDEEYECSDEDSNDFFWDTDARPGRSYATVVKKPKLVEIPMFLERNLGNKKVKVKFDSWHMLINPKTNRFYCMVCKDYSHIRSKAEHCEDSTHLENLEKCRIITSFGDYLIREVDDKCYHCGHCNNLVIINDMGDHVKKYHSKFNKNAKNNDTVKKSNNKNNDIPDNDKNNNDTYNINDNANGAIKNGAGNNDNTNILDKIASKNNKENHINILNKNDDFNRMLYGKIVFPIFGYRITIPVLSYNVICKRPNDYFCGLCNVICSEVFILQHISSLPHIHLLQRTPFILPFNCNLIRAIREAMHCAICNIPVAAAAIYFHIRELQHSQSLILALSANGPGIIPSNHNPNIPNPQNQLAYNAAVKITPKISVTETRNEATKTKTTEKNVIKHTVEKPLITQTVANEKLKTTKNLEMKPKIVTEIKLTEEVESTNEDLNVSVESEVDFEEYVYVKIRNAYFKINVLAYNSLAHVGDNKRYCFVCSSKVNEEEMKKHVVCRKHLENLEDCKFLDNDGTLLRQLFLMYHCTTCNVLISRKELKNHLNWPTHTEQLTSSQSASKKMRKKDLKSGTKLYVPITQKEITYLNEKETEYKILFKIKIVNKDIVLDKRMKIVIVGGDVLKIDFQNWNGLASVKNGFKCQLCQIDFTEEDLPSHVACDGHARYLASSAFHQEYVSDLMRKINESTLHCMVCNTVVSNKDYIVLEHVDGKKHKKNYEAIKNKSSTTSAYTDCEGDVLQL